MNGLASITPKGFQTPPQNQGLGQLMGGPKPTAREQMAIEVVNDDVEPLDLDPKLEAALKLGEAKELLQSANKVLAPNPANVVQQLQQEVPAGIAALTARMQGAPQGLPRPMPRQTPPPRPMPPGIMGMAQQMAAANQQGRQAPMPQRPPMPMQNAPQRAPAPRPPMAGGLPQLPSNLPRAAQGGIVAFKDGGFPDLSGDGKVTRKDILMGRGVVSKAAGGLAVGNILSEADSYISAQAILNSATSTDQEKAFARATLDSLRPREEGGNMTMNQYAAMMQEVSRRQQGGMAGGGIVGFSNGQMVRGAGRRAQSMEEEEEERKRAARIAARNNRYAALLADGVPPEEASRMASITEYDPTGEETALITTQPGQEVITTQVDEEEAPYPPQRLLPPDEVEEVSEKVITGPDGEVDISTLIGDVDVEDYDASSTAFEELIKEGVEGRLGRDVTKEQEIATARLDELTGLDELRAEQRTAEQARRALREERFTPEEERRRLLRAGLLGTAEQGLGGFAKGTMDAENRIYAEQLEAAQEDVATMDKITDTFQQLGLSKFEAEQNTFKLVEDGINSGLSAGASLANALRQAELTARQQDLTLASTVRGQDTQMAIAKIQQENSEFSQTLNILIAEETARNPTGTKQEIQSAALEQIFEQDLKSKLALLGVQESDLQRKAFSDAIKAAVDMVAGDISLITDPAARNAKIFELAEQMQSMNAFSGTTQNIPTVTTQAQFDALESGALFIENGQTFRKP